MRVLVVGAKPPRLPIRDGYVVHLYHLVRVLASLADVCLIYADDGGGPVNIAGVSIIVSDGEDALAALVQQAISTFEPDVVHAIGTPVAWAVATAAQPTVLGALDAPHLNIDAVQASGVSATLRKMVRRFRSLRAVRGVYGKFDSIVVVSDEDRTALLDVNPQLSVEVIANGVELGAFAHDPSIDRVPDRILFTGALGYPPNVAAARFLAEEVFPLVRMTNPDATLQLVGREPADSVLRLGEADGVEVVGPVDDMAVSLSAASVYVCPMVSGTGIKNKLLEALANGLPTVATPLATRGMHLAIGTDVIVDETPEGLATAVVRLLDDSDLRQSVASAGQRYVHDQHTWESVAAKYLDVYRRLLP